MIRLSSWLRSAASKVSWAIPKRGSQSLVTSSVPEYLALVKMAWSPLLSSAKIAPETAPTPDA